jgi:hypothetical protein
MDDRAYSASANAYVKVERRGTDRVATWFDVAAAYDAGMKHALEALQSAKAQIKKLHARCAEVSKP